MLAFGAPGLFGKIPASGDFVRVRAAEPVGLALARWLEEASEGVKSAGAAEGRDPVRFLFRPPGGARALVGVLAGSADKVGRRFPLPVFAPAEGSELAEASPALSAAARPFLDAGAALLGEAARVGAAELPARLDALPLLAPEALAREQARARAAAAVAPASELLGRLFGDLASGQHLYGLHCVRSACLPVRGREPGGAGVALDCPAREDLDRFAWLELVRRAVGWAHPPSFFWSEGPEPRLLVCIGAPSPALLGALWDCARRAAGIWPLTTERPPAIAAARKALGPGVGCALERPEATVDELIAVASSLT